MHVSRCCSLSPELSRAGASAGLLVDWLEKLDPEVISACPELQQKLLFALNKVIMHGILGVCVCVSLCVCACMCFVCICVFVCDDISQIKLTVNS